MWKDFEANNPEVNLSLLEENIDAVSFSVIMALVSAQLTDWENSIFGVSGVASTGDDKASTKTVSYIVGEFEKYSYGEHYRGELELGQGLIGQILLDFQKNAAKEQSGWDALEAPGWERKLWCSDTFPGPSVREFSTMVASIVATVCTFGAGAAVAIAVNAGVMAANELTFELADVGAGWHDWDEAARNVAKAAVSGAITGAASSLSGVASNVGGIGGAFLKTGITSSSSITTQFTNAFIDDGFSGVVDAFNSWSDWQGIAFSTAGSFVTNGVGYGLSNTNFTGFNSLQMGQINSIAGTVGGLTTNALEYAFTGQTSFNLLNLSMFGLEYGSMWGGSATNTLSGGFLSMTVGQNGTHFAISSAGTDISLGTLYSNAMGIGHIVENSKIESYASDYGNPSAATTLRIQYGYGDKESNTLLDEILSGKTKLSLTSEKKDGATAQTTTDANGNKTVTLYGITADMSIEDMFKAGLVLQHEAHRDGVNGDNQSAETLSAVAAHTDMMSRIVADGLYTQNLMQLVKEDRTLQGDLIARAMGSDVFEKYVGENYDSTGDYWKLLKDGSLAYDGDGWLRNEEGQIIQDENGDAIGAAGVQTGLEKILNLKDSKEAVKIMRQMGLEYKKDEKGNVIWYVKEPSAGTKTYDLTLDLDTKYQALDIYTREVKESMYTTGTLDSVVEHLSFPRGSYEYSSDIDQYLADLLDKTIERNEAIKNSDVAKYESEVKERIDAAVDKPVPYGDEAKYDNKGIPTLDSAAMVCTQFASYASQEIINAKVAQFIDNLGLYQFDQVSPEIARPTDLIAILAHVPESGEENNHIVVYLGNNKIAESAESKITNGVRYSKFSNLLNYYNNNGYKYEISYYRPRGYRK